MAIIPTIVVEGIQGKGGPPPVTTLITPFTQPASAGTVTATFGTTAWMVPGGTQHIEIQGGGDYTVLSLATDGKTATITNTGVSGNATPGATVSGPTVGVGGQAGQQGAPGLSATALTAALTLPAANGSTQATMTVGSTSTTPAGAYVIIAGSPGATVLVASVTDSTHAQVVNPVGLLGQAAPGTVFAIGTAVGPGGPPGGTIGSATYGRSTVIVDQIPPTTCPQSVTTTVYTLPGLGLQAGERCSMAVEVHICDANSTVVGHFERRITVINNGTILNAQGTTADTDLSSPPPPNNINAGLAGASCAIVVASGTLAVQVTAPSGASVDCAGLVNAIRTQGPAVPPPSIALGNVDIGIYEGGTTVSGTGTNLIGAAFTIDGIAVTPTIGGVGTTWSFTTPSFTTGTTGSGNTNGYYATITATTSSGSASLTGNASFFVLPSGTLALYVATQGTTPATPTNGQALSVWADPTGLASQQQPTSANQPTYIAASAINSKPAVRVTATGGSGGVPQAWATAPLTTPHTGQPLTQLLVGCVNTPEAPSGFGHYLSSSDSPAIVRYATNNYDASYDGSFRANHAPMVAFGTPFIMSNRYSGTTNTVRVNGSDGSGVALTTSYTLSVFCIGSAVGAALPMGSLDTALALLSSKCWQTADYTGFGVYASHKWGLTP